MTSPTVEYLVEDRVATITLCRPESGNALDLPTAELLTEIVQGISGRDDVGAVLLLGQGPLFCAGGDVAAMGAAADPAAFVLNLATAAHRAILALAELEIPVVAGVQGAAAGAGLALTLVSDLVVAEESASFLMAYTNIGLTPDCGTSWLLPQVIGLRRALELGLTPRRLSAAEALDWGLVTSIAPTGQVEEPARKLAVRLAQGPTQAFARARSLIRGAATHSLAQQLDREAAGISAAAGTADAQDRIAAFLKRSANR